MHPLLQSEEPGHVSIVQNRTTLYVAVKGPATKMSGLYAEREQVQQYLKTI